MNEADTRKKLIDPQLKKAGWNFDDIRQEFIVRENLNFTDGTIILNQNVERKKPLRADYLLCYKHRHLAIVEAKHDGLEVSEGLEQAKNYARKLGLNFAYSTNGKGFAEYDFSTGLITNYKADEFPSPQELLKRELAISGIKNAEEEKLFLSTFDSYRKTPRYYQLNALNFVLEKIAKKHKRMLLVMATGSGKTFTASIIANSLLKAKHSKKILYLADRNNLIDQTMRGDFRHFKGITKISGKEFDPAFEIYFGLYQQFIETVSKDNIKEYIKKNPHKKHLIKEEIDPKSQEIYYLIEHYKEFDKNFFDTIFIDECHRSSRKENSIWKKILEYYQNAVQIGMTATPKVENDGSNLEYFGDNTFIYSLKQGIEDGFLAPFRVFAYGTNVDVQGYLPEEGKTDIYGEELERRIYRTPDFDNTLAIEERRELIAKIIKDFIVNKLQDKFAKTIIFCDDQEHALKMRDCLSNEFADLQKEYNGEFVVRITSNEDQATYYLEKFQSTLEENKIPVIATTSDLMRTGADTKLAKLLVFDCSVGSLSEFKQMLGRGTRIDENNGKYYFTILDFKNATKWLAYDIDALPEPIENIKTPLPKTPKPKQEGEKRKKFYINEVEVKIDIERELIYHNGKVINTNFIDYTKENFLKEYPNLSLFLAAWNSKDNLQKTEFLKLLEDKGILINELKSYDKFKDLDEFDILISLAYGLNALSRTQRAKKANKILEKYSPKAKEILEILLEKYAQNGISELENLANTFKNPPFEYQDLEANLKPIFASSANDEDWISNLRNAILEIKNAIYDEAA